MAGYVEGVRDRATAARAILAKLKDARNAALRDLAKLEKQQVSANNSVRTVLDKLDDDLELPDDSPAEVERKYDATKSAIEEALGSLDEGSSLVGDFSYELDITEGLKSIEGTIKASLHHGEKAARAAAKAGITL